MDALWWSAGLVAIGIAAAGLLAQGARRMRMDRAARLPDGAAPARVAGPLSARVFVDRPLVGGPAPGAINHTRARLVLGADRFLIATPQGRLLEIRRDNPGTAVCTGPRRLVVQGLHPSGDVRVRTELLVDDAEGWAQAIRGLAP